MVFSSSRLKTFQTCKLKFKLTYLLNLQNKNFIPSFSTDLGKAFHEFVEKWNESIDSGSLVQEILSKYQLKFPQELEKRVFNYMGYYYRRLVEYPDFETEKEINFTIASHRFVAYIDRFCRSSDGKIVLFDWKTGSYLPSDHEFQIKLYLVGVSLALDVPPEKVEAYLYFPRDNREAGPYILSREEYRSFVKYVIHILEEIENEKEFPPTKNYLCKEYCEFSGTDYCQLSIFFFGRSPTPPLFGPRESSR